MNRIAKQWSGRHTASGGLHQQCHYRSCADQINSRLGLAVKTRLPDIPHHSHNLVRLLLRIHHSQDDLLTDSILIREERAREGLVDGHARLIAIARSGKTASKQRNTENSKILRRGPAQLRYRITTAIECAPRNSEAGREPAVLRRQQTHWRRVRRCGRDNSRRVQKRGNQTRRQKLAGLIRTISQRNVWNGPDLRGAESGVLDQQSGETAAQQSHARKHEKSQADLAADQHALIRDRPRAMVRPPAETSVGEGAACVDTWGA